MMTTMMMVMMMRFVHADQARRLELTRPRSEWLLGFTRGVDIEDRRSNAVRKEEDQTTKEVQGAVEGTCRGERGVVQKGMINSSFIACVKCSAKLSGS